MTPRCPLEGALVTVNVEYARYKVTVEVLAVVTPVILSFLQRTEKPLSGDSQNS